MTHTALKVYFPVRLRIVPRVVVDGIGPVNTKNFLTVCGFLQRAAYEVYVLQAPETDSQVPHQA